MSYKQMNKTLNDFNDDENVGSVSTHTLRLDEDELEVRLGDVFLDVTVLWAVKKHKHMIMDFNQYWDEDGNFCVKDESLLPLTRFENILQPDGILPPIVLYKSSITPLTKYEYDDGRHRHLRLLIKYNCDPDRKLTYGVDYVFNFKKENSEEDVLFQKRANTRFIVYDYKKNVVQMIEENDFNRRELPLIELMGFKCKYKNTTRREARNMLIKILSNATFKKEGLVDMAYKAKDTFLDFLEGVSFIVKSIATVGRTTRDAGQMYENFKNTFIKPVVDNPIADFVKTYGISLIRLFSSLINFVKNKACGFMDIVNVILDLISLGKDALFRKESLDTLLLLGVGSLVPSIVLDSLKRLQVLTSKRIFDETGCMYEILSSISTIINSVVDILPEAVKPFAQQFMNLFGLSEYVLVLKSRTLVQEWKKDLKIIVEVSFRNRVKEFHKQINDLLIKRFFSRSKNLSEACDDFERLFKAVTSYEETSRQEPSCFVFEGPPGCRKSVTVNKVINVLGLPHYAHTVKCAEDSKDWYDAYNNEQIFYMDDVGQMGVSQWRSLINWVSAVKLPLDCAEAKLKDTKFFNSDILLLTTNNFMNLQGFTSKDCISSPEALWRRGYVFDFKNVKGVGDAMEGTCSFKHYDINAKVFLKGFPKDFIEYCSMHDVVIGDICDVSNQNEFLLWITTIITGFNEMKKEQLDNNTLKDDDINNIRRGNPFLKESGDLKSMMMDYIEFGTHMIMSFISDFLCVLRAPITKPLYFGLGIYLGSVLLCLLYKVYTCTSEGGVITVDQDTDSLKCLDLKQEHTMLRKITNQMFSAQVAVEHPDGSITSGYCIGCVSGRFVILPLHMMEGYDVAQLTLFKGPRQNNQRYIDNMLVTLLWSDSNNDVAIVKLRDGFPTPFPSLSKCFKNDPGSIVGLAFPGEVVELKGILEKNPYQHCPLVYSVRFKDRKKVEVKTPLMYYLHGPGMCGVLSVTNTGMIRGMHVAGSDELNAGITMLWEAAVIEKIRNILDSPDHGLKLSVDINDKVSIDTSAIKVNSNLTNFVPKNTNIIESPLHGVFPISRFPAELSMNGPHTVKDCFNPSKIPIDAVRLTELAYARSVLDLYFEDYTDLEESSIVSGDEELARMNPKSSNGLFLLKDKKDCFDYENSCFTTQFRQLYDDFERKMNTGEISPSDIAWTETLKDELRVPNKLPRSFRVCPVTVQVLTKKCFGNLVKKIVRERWFNEIMIGLNPFSEWGKVKQSVDGSYSWAGDVKWYDKLMRSQAAMCVVDAMMNRYIGKNPIAARNVLENIAYCYVVVNDDNYILTHTLPSGSWLTAIFNSLVNRVYTLMWYHREMRKINRKITPFDFHKDVTDLVYGDDRVNKCKNKQYSQSLNALTMLDFFTSIGMDMTDSLKKPIVTPFQPLCELTFLKRSFVYHPILQVFTCPLDLTTVYSSLSWIDGKKDEPMSVLRDKINAFQREIFLHYDVYDRDINILERACEERDIPFVKLPQHYLVQLYRSGEYDNEYNCKYGLLSSTLVSETLQYDLLKKDDGIKSGLRAEMENEIPFRLNRPVVKAIFSEFKTKDLTTELQTIKDRYHTSLRTKTIIEHEDIFDQLPRVDHVAPMYQMHFEQILNKPFLVKTMNWSTASTTKFVELDRLAFPAAITTNALAQIPFDASTFFQMQACVMLQVSGTPMHQGCLLAAAIPHNSPSILTPNSILSAPHVFLNANEASSVCLELPMYCLNNLARTQANGLQFSNAYFGPDICDLVIYLMNPLTTGAGSSSTISVSIHCMVKKAEFYVPKNGRLTWQAQCGRDSFPKTLKFLSKQEVKAKLPHFEASLEVSQDIRFKKEGLMDTLYSLPTTILDDTARGMKKVCGDIIDYTRATVRTMTGFHNPVIPYVKHKMLATFKAPTNAVDIPQHLEVLDNHAMFSRIVDDYYFRTTQDEMDLKYLVNKPVYLGTFNVSSTSIVGENLFAHPITPMVEANVVGGTAGFTYASPLRNLYEHSRHWRGGLKLHIQAVATNFHFCKIAVFKNYHTPALSLVTTTVPSYSSIHNINLDTMEFSAGGQVQTIELPFCSTNRQLECTKDFVANITMHGMVYGYLVQPLTFNGNVPLSVAFNVYMSAGDDFEFSGYGTDVVNLLGGADPSYPALSSGFEDVLEYAATDSETRPTTIGRYEKGGSGVPTVPLLQPSSWFRDVSFVHMPVSNKEKSVPNVVRLSQPVRVEDMGDFKSAEALEEEEVEGEEEENMLFKAESDNGNVATVGESDQSALQGSSMGYIPPSPMGVCPNVSVRDYVRRFHSFGPLTFTPTSLRGAIQIPLRSFMRPSNGVTPFSAFTTMYYGMSGGFKIKIKTIGVNSASILYLPPGVYVNPLEETFRSYQPVVQAPGDVNVAADNGNRAGFRPLTTPYPLTQQEMQDYTRSYNQASNSTPGRPGHVFTLEVATPHINMNNLVGGCGKWLSSAPTDIPEDDYGTILIYYESSFDNALYQSVTIVPYIALNDEARLGFLSYQPLKEMLRVVSSVTGIPLARAGTPFFTIPVLGANSAPGAPRLNGIPTVPYFFNP